MGFSRQECWSGVPLPSPLSSVPLKPQPGNHRIGDKAGPWGNETELPTWSPVLGSHPLIALPEDKSWTELTLALRQNLNKMLDALPKEGRPTILLLPLYEKGSAPNVLEFFRVHFNEIINYAFAMCGHKAALIEQHHVLEDGNDILLEVDGDLTANEVIGAKIGETLEKLLSICLGFAGKVKIASGDFSSEHDQEKEKEEAERAAKLAKQKEEQEKDRLRRRRHSG